jgi:hypothetical protein
VIAIDGMIVINRHFACLLSMIELVASFTDCYIAYHGRVLAYICRWLRLFAVHS